MSAVAKRWDVRLAPALLASWLVSWLVLRWEVPPQWAVLGVVSVSAIGAGVVWAGGRRTPSAEQVGHPRQATRPGPRALTQLLSGPSSLLVIASIAGGLAAVSAGQLVIARAVAQQTLQPGAQVQFVATAASDPTTSADGARWHFEANVQHVWPADVGRADGSGTRIHGAVRVHGRGEPPRVAYGQSVSVTGKVAAWPGVRRQVVKVFAVSAPTPEASPAAWVRWASRLRQDFAALCAQQDGPGISLVPGMLIGDTSAQPQHLTEAMRRTGLSHLTAVSGTNVTIVAGAIILALTVAGAGRWVRTVGGVLGVVALVVIARPEPSVQRAAVMGTLGLVAVVGSRRAGHIPGICAAATLLLWWDPWLSHSVGFALSVAATTGICLGGQWLARGLGKLMPLPLAQAVAVSLLAQVACTPILFLVTDRLSLVGVLCNVLVAPAVGIATVCAAVSVAALPFAPLLSDIAVAPAVWCANYIAWVAYQLNTWPAAEVAVPQRVWWLAGAAVALTIGAVVWARRPTSLAVPTLPWASGSPLAVILKWMQRRPATLGLTVAVTAVLVALRSAHIIQPGVVTHQPPPGWVVAVCDVGQGSAVLVRSAGAVALFDVGPAPTDIRRCLERHEVRHIDLLVISHFHADHVGGLAQTLGVPVNEAIVPAVRVPGSHADRTLRMLTESGVLTSVAGADAKAMLPEMELEFLWPTSGAAASLARQRSPDGAAINEASIVTRAVVGGVRVLIPGDIERVSQSRLADVVGDGPAIDVFVAPHHGSATQEPRLWQAARPRVVLFSAGRYNDYGHPSAAALGLAQEAGAVVGRTDRDGDLWLVPTSDGSLQLYRQQPG